MTIPSAHFMSKRYFRAEQGLRFKLLLLGTLGTNTCLLRQRRHLRSPVTLRIPTMIEFSYDENLLNSAIKFSFEETYISPPYNSPRSCFQQYISEDVGLCNLHNLRHTDQMRISIPHTVDLRFEIRFLFTNSDLVPIFCRRYCL